MQFQFISTLDYMNPFDPKYNSEENYGYTSQSLEQDDKDHDSQAQEPENPFDSLNYSRCFGNNLNPSSNPSPKSQLNFHLTNKPFAGNSPSHLQAPNSLKSPENLLDLISHKRSFKYEDAVTLNQASTHDSYPEFSLCDTPKFTLPEQNFDSPHPQSTFSENNTSEDDFEESPQDLSRKKDKKTASDKSRTRKNSNLLRNAPGLIFGRVKKGCKEYIGGNEEERDHEDQERLEYIKTIIENGKLIHLNFNEERFVKFLEKFNGSTKTWKSLKDACMEDKLNARIFLQCVDSFLSENGEKDFENWVSEDRGSDVKSEIKRKKFALLKKLHSTVGFLYRKSVN